MAHVADPFRESAAWGQLEWHHAEIRHPDELMHDSSTNSLVPRYGWLRDGA